MDHSSRPMRKWWSPFLVPEWGSVEWQSIPLVLMWILCIENGHHRPPLPSIFLTWRLLPYRLLLLRLAKPTSLFSCVEQPWLFVYLYIMPHLLIYLYTITLYVVNILSFQDAVVSPIENSLYLIPTSVCPCVCLSFIPSPSHQVCPWRCAKMQQSFIVSFIWQPCMCVTTLPLSQRDTVSASSN